MASESDLPLVVIATPIHNGKRFLDQLIKSVQGQTYKNIIHLIVENKSTDGTLEAVREYSKKYPNVFLVETAELLPVTDNWNYTLSHVPADAKYVKWLCVDDWISSTAIEKLTLIAESDPDIDYVSARDTYDGELKTNNLEKNKVVYSGPDFLRLTFLGRAHWHQWCHMFFRVRQGFLDNPFRHSFYPAIDTDFVQRCLLSRTVAILDEPLFYTTADSNTMTAQAGGFGAHLFTNLELLIEHGQAVFTSDEYERLHREHLVLAVRKVMTWRILGKSHLADWGLKRLNALGITVDAATAARMLVTWPADKLKTIYRSRAPSGGLSQAIDPR